MRIIGVLLIILSLAPLWFVGWTEFSYLSNDKNIYNNNLDSAKIYYEKNLKIYKNNYTATNQKNIEEAKSIFESSIDIAKDTMSTRVNLVRDVWYIAEILIIATIMLLLGLFLTFKKKS